MEIGVFDYYPYGKMLREFQDNVNEKYLTTHHQRDEETTLDYRYARFYDSDLGRFLSIDPMAADYASWSGYNYVVGNPVAFTDPTGAYPNGDGDVLYDNPIFIADIVRTAFYDVKHSLFNVGAAIYSYFGEGPNGETDGRYVADYKQDGNGNFETEYNYVQGESGLEKAGSVVLDGVQLATSVSVGGSGMLMSKTNGTVRVKDLVPIHSEGALSKSTMEELSKLSDTNLLKSVTNPSKGDYVQINTQTGKVSDGNHRAIELQRRANDPNSTITPNTEVPYQNYTPPPKSNYFYDMNY